jgi:two-component sensor histidine kinase
MDLCTNTTKFGALLVPAGRVDIAWTLDPQTSGHKPQRLHLTWTEKKGQPVQVPEKRSFGSRLVETLSKQLKGDVKLTYEPTGFVFEFHVQLALLKIAAK